MIDLIVLQWRCCCWHCC